jgi:hypothetical protein
MKKLGLTYEEFTTALMANGWGYHAIDMSWRAKANDPLSEPVASYEALRDFCEIWPPLTHAGLAILLAGHGFDITINQTGYETTVQLRPSVQLVSTNPEVFARPVKLGSP